jgi:tRNA pseudouridine13 synthase
MGTRKYKLKTTFEDFYVEERHDFKLVEEGDYSLFKLDKTGMETLVALRIIAKQLRVQRKNIGYSGLKDRYSSSTQFVTIPRKALETPKEPENCDFTSKSIDFSYVGQLEKPLRLGSHTSNYFKLTLRRLNQNILDLFKRNLEVFQKGGPVPNYFDSQKFGYLKGPEGFFAGKFLNGEYEDALKLVIARHNRKERASSKLIHQYLQEHWHDWKACSKFLSEHPYENYLKLTRYLESEPEDFLGAIKLFTRDKMKLKITSLQAYLWNEYLKSNLQKTFSEVELVNIKYHVGTIPFPVEPVKNLERLAGPELFSQTIPLPSTEVTGEYRENYDRFLNRDFGLDDLSEFEKFNQLGYRTNAHERKMFFTPSNLVYENEGRDEEIKREKNRYCTITFELPPGSYATILIKGIMLA